jgi:hypothetical protein
MYIENYASDKCEQADSDDDETRRGLPPTRIPFERNLGVSR